MTERNGLIGERQHGKLIRNRGGIADRSDQFDCVCIATLFQILDHPDRKFAAAVLHDVGSTSAAE